MKFLFSKISLVVYLLVSFSPAWAQARTPEELITQVLKAVEAKDAASLKALSISDDEVKRLVWPPAIIGNGVTADSFTSTFQRSSAAGLNTVLSEYGGKKLQLTKVEMPKPSKQSNGAKVYPAPKIAVKDESGQEKSAALIGGVLEQGGTYRVSTYYVAPTTR